jgi:Tfp pilus assembly protein PilV
MRTSPRNELRIAAGRGFNLVEALVATMILSGAVLTLGAISTNALSGTRLHRHYEMAAALVDKQLNLIDYMGIDSFLEAGQTEGIVDDMEPVFRWSVATEYQGTDDLYLVALTVTWLEGNRPYSVTVQTMLNGANSGTALSTSTETGGEQAQ